MKKIILIVFVVIISLLLLFNGKEGDTKEFEKIINSIVISANEKDLEKFMSYFSIHYSDEHGGNYLYIKSIAKNTFEDFEKFDVYYENISVARIKSENSQDIAVLNFDVVVSGIKNGIPIAEIIGSSGHLENLTIEFKKSDLRKWKIINVEGINDKNFYQ
ncbi:MAG: hypothetical protein GTO02_01995 [Candidatus Dadabacteria bacterium]|nr:hypothetical protein [Candidatus Dadabacteria bacterium]NIQ13208.1 hypothetical protein [Candidatus Dadabacteria bacterium]